MRISFSESIDGENTGMEKQFYEGDTLQFSEPQGSITRIDFRYVFTYVHVHNYWVSQFDTGLSPPFIGTGLLLFQQKS